MIPRPFYTRLVHMELAMVAMTSPAVAWLASAPPTVPEWEDRVARIEGQTAPARVFLPMKAASDEQWVRECRRTWETR